MSILDQFKRLFGIRDRTHDPNIPRLAPSSIGPSSVAGWLQERVPVFVPCFNNPTYAAGMLDQLRRWDFRHIVIVDNASTSADMRAWLAGIGTAASVVRLDYNLGPRDIFLEPKNLALLPQWFCVTDPDLVFNPRLPRDFLSELALMIEKHRVGKAGFALDISNRKSMRQERYRIGEKDWRIWEWEAQFWKKPVDMLAGGDLVYDAPIDTTFALYDKRYFDSANFLRAVRVAGRFTARHLPWYKDNGLTATEQNEYGRTSKFSFFKGVQLPTYD